MFTEGDFPDSIKNNRPPSRKTKISKFPMMRKVRKKPKENKKIRTRPKVIAPGIKNSTYKKKKKKKKTGMHRQN